MKIMVTNATASFPVLDKPKSFDPSQEKTYSIDGIFDKGSDAHKVLDDAIDKVGTDKWGADWKDIKPNLESKSRICMRDGSEKGRDEYNGKLFFKASRKESEGKVKIVDEDNMGVTAADGKCYGGSTVNILVDIWAQDHPLGGKRINAKLLGVQHVADGEPFGSTVSANDDDFAVLNSQSYL